MDTYRHRITATPPTYWEDRDKNMDRRIVLDEADLETAASEYKFYVSEGWRDVTVDAYKPTYETITDPIAWFRA